MLYFLADREITKKGVENGREKVSKHWLQSWDRKI